MNKNLHWELHTAISTILLDNGIDTTQLDYGQASVLNNKLEEILDLVMQPIKDTI